MNKYIDHLTVEEYKIIKEQLKARLPELTKRMDTPQGKKSYIDTRFLIIKIENIIKKYEKKV